MIHALSALAVFFGIKAATAAKDVATAAPEKTVTVIHAMLSAIEAKEGPHPLLLQATEWIDELVEKHGETFILDVEKAVFDALTTRYPGLTAVLNGAQAAGAAAAPSVPAPAAAPTTPPAPAK